MLETDPTVPFPGSTDRFEDHAVEIVANLDPPLALMRFGVVDFLNRSILDETLRRSGVSS